mmetsp:Transcript_5807/g.10437  ORF Transcript_5807/g.10437 Transcript_5807/m.10437 type:complete len:239 (-) Transcript_5807:841-1557(-)
MRHHPTLLRLECQLQPVLFPCFRLAPHIGRGPGKRFHDDGYLRARSEACVSHDNVLSKVEHAREVDGRADEHECVLPRRLVIYVYRGREIQLRRRHVFLVHRVGLKDVLRLLLPDGRHGAQGGGVPALHHPRLPLQLPQRYPLLRVYAQHPLQQRTHLRAEPGRHLVVGGDDLLEQARQCGFVEGEASRQDHIQHHTQRPDVRGRPLVPLLRQHLRRHIVGCAARGHQLPILRVHRVR